MYFYDVIWTGNLSSIVRPRVLPVFPESAPWAFIQVWGVGRNYLLLRERQLGDDMVVLVNMSF